MPINTYRIKHLPTGLYYCKTRYTPTEGIPTNLDETGKIYSRRQQEKNIVGNFYSHIPYKETDVSQFYGAYKFIKEEWATVKCKLIDIS